jgi:formamidopyrimidine-DNA glycosylase
MTGEVAIEPPGDEAPRFWKLDLALEDGRRIVMSDARRLGRLRLRVDPLAEPPIRDLGFDPLLDLPRRADFAALLARTSRPLKALLLDQSFSAGVGNWVADEVLFQAGLDPRRAADSLSDGEAETLRQALGRVVRHAVRVGADSARFPKDWLFHRRWGRKKDAVTHAGDAIRFLVIGGRTTAWVPSVQRPATPAPRRRRGGAKRAAPASPRGPRSSRS